MQSQFAFRTLIWLGQLLPPRVRLSITRSRPAGTLRRLLARSQPHGSIVVPLSAPLAGYRMKLDMHSPHRRFALGTYEPEVCGLIESKIQTGQVVMDIGANIGYLTLLMARLVGSTGKVFAFEPIPSVFELLQENITLNSCSQVEAKSIALAGRDGELTMQFDTTNPYSFTSQLVDSGNLTVSAMTLDHFVQSEGLKALDFLKIDVEGAEADVCKGMSETLARFHPTILIEIHADDGKPNDALVLLQEHGYRLWRLGPQGLTPCEPLSEVGHVLAS